MSDKSRNITSKQEVLMKLLISDYSLTAVQKHTESSVMLQTKAEIHGGTANRQTDVGRHRVINTEG